jgi:mRNA interferase RelE/StbE
MNARLSKNAAKTLRGLDAPTRERIAAGIRGIPKGDIKPLVGYKGTLRLRVGDWRILFSYADENNILIERISPRGEAYKGV